MWQHRPEQGSKEQPFLLTSLGAGSEPPSRAAPLTAELHFQTFCFLLSLFWLCPSRTRAFILGQIHCPGKSKEVSVLNSMGIRLGPLDVANIRTFPAVYFITKVCLTFSWCSFNHVKSKCSLCPFMDKNNNNPNHLLNVWRGKKTTKKVIWQWRNSGYWLRNYLKRVNSNF